MTAFFDTNVLIYLVSASDRKAGRAFELTRQGGWISVQVLNEMVRVLRGKLGYDWPLVHITLGRVQDLVSVAPLTIATHRLGLELAERHCIAVFDAMIVAAAVESGCQTLYAEDMQHGLRVAERLRIENPFRGE